MVDPALLGYCPANFAYVNENDDAAKEKMSALQLAYAMGKTVTRTLQPGMSNYCYILEIDVTG
jgi:hypothetical protein